MLVMCMQALHGTLSWALVGGWCPLWQLRLHIAHHAMPDAAGVARLHRLGGVRPQQQLQHAVCHLLRSKMGLRDPAHPMATHASTATRYSGDGSM